MRCGNDLSVTVMLLLSVIVIVLWRLFDNSNKFKGWPWTSLTHKPRCPVFYTLNPRRFFHNQPRLIEKTCLWQHFWKMILFCFLYVSWHFQSEMSAKRTFSFILNRWRESGNIYYIGCSIYYIGCSSSIFSRVRN